MDVIIDSDIMYRDDLVTILYPNIKKGATIFASSTILGDITIGEKAIVAAGSLVLKDVKKETTVAGIPAKEVNKLNISHKSWDPGDSGL